MTTDPPNAPVAAAPDVGLMNLMSLIRLVFGLLAGGLGVGAAVSSDKTQAVLSAILTATAVAWILLKNTAWGAKLEAALTAPAATVVTKEGIVKAGPQIVPLLVLGFLLIAASSGLVACANRPLIPASSAVIVAEGETSLDLAYNVAAKAYLRQLPTMDPALKAKVKPLLLKAGGLVQAADGAEVLGNETSMAAQIADAMAIIGQVKSALGVP